MKENIFYEVKIILLFAVSLITLISLISYNPYDLEIFAYPPNIPLQNYAGLLGVFLGGIFVFLFGRIPSFIIPFFLFLIGLRLLKKKEIELRLPQIVAFLIFLFSISGLIGFSLKNEIKRFIWAGFLGWFNSIFFLSYIGFWGSYICFLALAILSFVLVTQIPTFFFIGKSYSKLSKIFSGIKFFSFKKTDIAYKKAPLRKDTVSCPSNIKEEREEKVSTPKIKIDISETVPKIQKSQILSSSKISIRSSSDSKDKEESNRRELKPEEYSLPPLDLLSPPPSLEARQIKEDLEESARILEETLEDFGVSVKVTNIQRGPTITRYELEPAPGVKVNRIVALSDDIALAMKAQSVRVIAPIPGRGRVGVEVPNVQSSFVYLREVLETNEFQKSSSKLTLAIGKDIAGQAVVADLTQMPHLLIAGATGSGKTVCVNSLILSLLFRCTPQELKFIMVDPKMVELSIFNGIAHLLCPVINEAKQASSALSWVVNEMEERYRLLAKVGARNIEIYNEKQEAIPYIVVIIDELADLMMVARDQIESAIIRLAQLSRAVGIHLVLATQRPSVDVVTGVIKANFPARISFKVASKVDSRTVLDINGADKLLGKGDLLFLRPGETKLIRAQGSFVTDQEIERVVEFIKKQAQPLYDEEILKEKETRTLEGEKDPLYNEAVKLILETNQASISILQRRLKLGYTRAARIIDMMEQEGIIGPFEGSKPRKILIDRNTWLENTLSQDRKEENYGTNRQET